MRRLMWICAVCLCTTKRTLGLYGLNNANAMYIVTRGLQIGMDLDVRPYLMCARREGSDEAVWMRKLIWVFTDHRFD